MSGGVSFISLGGRYIGVLTEYVKLKGVPAIGDRVRFKLRGQQVDYTVVRRDWDLDSEHVAIICTESQL
jgi:hypothetical protein